MKQAITPENWNEMSEHEKLFIDLWRQRKGYPVELSVGHLIEFLIATTYNFHKDYSDSRFFNNILINMESSVGWDGQELIDILWYESIRAIKKRFSVRTITVEETVIAP